MGEINTVDLEEKIRKAAPVAPGTAPEAPAKTDQQQVADELGDDNPLEQRIADAKDYVPDDEEGSGSDVDRQELADQLPRVDPLKKRIEDAKDAE